MKHERNESLSLQLDHKWHHCHHLVLISFHLSAPPLRGDIRGSAYRRPPSYYFHGNSRTGGVVARRDERGYLYECV